MHVHKSLHSSSDVMETSTGLNIYYKNWLWTWHRKACSLLLQLEWTTFNTVSLPGTPYFKGKKKLSFNHDSSRTSRKDHQRCRSRNEVNRCGYTEFHRDSERASEVSETTLVRACMHLLSKVSKEVVKILELCNTKFLRAHLERTEQHFTVYTHDRKTISLIFIGMKP